MWVLTKLLPAGAVALALIQNAPPDHSDKTRNTTGSPQPVITVQGVCEKSAKKTNAQSNSCATTVAREDFEALVKALNPNGQSLPANARKNLAKTYAEYIAVEAAARKEGMEDTPEFRALMNWNRLRTITDLYRRKLQEKYNTPSPEDINAYYQQHLADFERVKLVRILIPRESATVANKEEFEKKAHETAASARENLVKGVDPMQIQKDTYAALGLSAPPAVDLGARRRNDFIAEESTIVFGLKADEISQVVVEPKNYVIYKLTGKDVMTRDEVKNDVMREVYRQKFQEAMKSVLDAAPAGFDDEYLDSPVKAAPAKAPASAPANP